MWNNDNKNGKEVLYKLRERLLGMEKWIVKWSIYLVF